MVESVFSLFIIVSIVLLIVGVTSQMGQSRGPQAPVGVCKGTQKEV